jgi:thioredoxin reductase (NADPH)
MIPNWLAARGNARRLDVLQEERLMTAAPASLKPVIFAVDDEPVVLGAVERDLRRHFGAGFRVVKAGSGPQALDAARALKQRDVPVALFLVDQRMPEMTGTQFLMEARKLYPEACTVLLTAYADTEAAIASINQIGLDHYLMKPWDPPEQHLYPVLDDLLAGWMLTAPIPYDGIRLAGALWSAASHDCKDFLARNRIPYLWLDVDQNPEARALVDGVTGAEPRLPVLFFPDGGTLVAPSRRDLAEKVGLRTQAASAFYDVIVVGAGPAGLAASVYASSEGLRTVLIEKEATGGQAGTSSRIENYVGFPSGLSGSDLAHRATAQARRFGAEIVTTQEVTAIRREPPYHHVKLADGTELGCYALIVATGVSVRRLDVPGAEALMGAGLYYGAALTEAAHYRGQHVLVLGGANSAGQGAVFFSRYASKVTMLVRGESLEQSMSRYLVEQIAAAPNIEVVASTSVCEIVGKDRLEAVVVQDATGARRELPAAALFVFIGAAPHSEFLAGVIERDAAGYVVTGLDLMKDGRWPASWTAKRPPLLLETSVPGIFAAGDVRAGSSKRVAAAVGEGAVAVQLVHQYLKTV